METELDIFKGASIKRQAMAMRQWLVDIRRDLHRNPELGLEENRTAGEIERHLAALGIESARTGTAVVGLLRGGRPGKTAALRADIDALPIREETGLDFASCRDGLMHACGHDAHAAILLGAARWFSEHRVDVSGNVKFLFQPAEETSGGAQTMIDHGCLENPRVDAVFGLHVMPYLPVGKIEIKKGALNGCSTTLMITIRGKGGHGAYPESAIDAILIAAQVVSALNTLVSRCVSPLESAVLSVGTIAGGTRSNIIADEVKMSATLRSTDDSVRDMLVGKARSMVEGISAANGGEGSLDVSYGYAALINHDEAVDLVSSAAQDVLGKDCVVWKEKPSMGVEDFSFFLKERMGAFYHLGCGGSCREPNAPLHSGKFSLDEDCLPLGVAIQVRTVLEFFGKPDRG